MATIVENKPEQAIKARVSFGWRVALSVLLLLHLVAIFIGPFTLATRGPDTASPLAVQVHQLFSPYTRAAFLDHGYFFFAPNPGPSHVVRYELLFEDQPPQTQTFPDLERQWPRLLYHRHFMLAEQWNARFVPPTPPPEMQRDPVRMAEWKTAATMYEAQRQSYIEHLKAKYAAKEVRLIRVEHRQPTPYEFEQMRIPLNDPSLYMDLPEDGLPEMQP